MKKPIYLTLLATFVGCNAMSQSPYLNMGHDELSSLLNMRGLDVMEMDSSHIHCVDDKKLRNMIFYFNDGVCVRVMTTFQKHDDFEKMVNFLDIKYGDLEGLKWVIPMEDGYDLIIAVRRRGYDIIDESFVTELDTVE